MFTIRCRLLPNSEWR